MVGERHAQKCCARIGWRAIRESGVETVDGEMRAGDPVCDEFPRGIMEIEWLSIGREIRLKDGAVVFAADLEQAAMAHGEHVEGAEGAVAGTDVGQAKSTGCR